MNLFYGNTRLAKFGKAGIIMAEDSPEEIPALPQNIVT